MRWPNDVMAGDRKLAGLLIDQFEPGRAVVGVGINVANQPEAAEASLAGKVARLADLVVPCPALEDLAARSLTRIREQHERLRDGTFAANVTRLETIWQGSRHVVLELDRGTRTGRFAGVDAGGRLRLVQPDGSESFFAAHEVRHLTEIQTDP
jgi:BirA family biotin operon repressor/biotin-[acetyl-CoA-carboxylase] ligase